MHPTSLAFAILNNYNKLYSIKAFVSILKKDMYRIYLDHGEAYGNLGEEAMLINASRRIRERIENVEFLLPYKQGMPLPDIGQKTEIYFPKEAIKYFIKKLYPSVQLRNWLDKRKINIFPWLLIKCMVNTGKIKIWNKFVDELRKCDAVYCVGCANLNDFARYECLLPKCILIEQARSLNLPVIVSSQTVGPLRLPWTKKAVYRAVNQSTHFSIRDGGISKNILVSLGIDPTRILTVGDEAFSLPVESKNNAIDILSKQNIDLTKPFGLFHFRATDYTQKTHKHFSKLSNALDKTDCESQIIFLPMSYGYHSGNDEECGKAIKDLMKQPEKLIVLKGIKNAQLVKQLVNMSQWVIALSYHLQVFAFSTETPMAILTSGDYYAVKAIGMQMLVGKDIPLIDLEKISSDVIAKIIKKLESERKKYVTNLNKRKFLIKKNNDVPINALVRSVKRL